MCCAAAPSQCIPSVHHSPPVHHTHTNPHPPHSTPAAQFTPAHPSTHSATPPPLPTLQPRPRSHPHPPSLLPPQVLYWYVWWSSGFGSPLETPDRQMILKLRFPYFIAPCIWWPPARRDAAARCDIACACACACPSPPRTASLLHRLGFPLYHASPSSNNNSKPYPPLQAFRVPPSPLHHTWGNPAGAPVASFRSLRHRPFEPGEWKRKHGKWT
jgi:hypothetical protein